MKKMEPVERRADSAFGKEGMTESHPAFGMIGIYRTSGTRHLFGSPLERHTGYVTIRVCRAERTSSGYGYDHFFARKQIIEVALSEAQFAQLITSWNTGDGVPCTLDWTEKEGMLPDWPDEDHVLTRHGAGTLPDPKGAAGRGRKRSGSRRIWPNYRQ